MLSQKNGIPQKDEKFLPIEGGSDQKTFLREGPVKSIVKDLVLFFLMLFAAVVGVLVSYGPHDPLDTVSVDS